MEIEYNSITRCVSDGMYGCVARRKKRCPILVIVFDSLLPPSSEKNKCEKSTKQACLYKYSTTLSFSLQCVHLFIYLRFVLVGVKCESLLHNIRSFTFTINSFNMYIRTHTFVHVTQMDISTHAHIHFHIALSLVAGLNMTIMISVRWFSDCNTIAHWLRWQRS